MAYSESDTRVKLIDPKIKESSWSENNIVREYYFTDGRKLIGNKRGKRYFVDYLLTYKNTNLAIIEAKAQTKDPLDGLQQSINYAQKLKIVTTTNAQTPLADNLKPLLVCDVWEHAYYIDVRNARPAYLENFWKLVNWDYVAENLDY
mgnify:CR=1 FL=1